MSGLFVCAILFFPVLVNAGFFSFVANFFNGEKETLAYYNSKEINSQNMVLLQAMVNPDPDHSIGGADITIIGNVALVSDQGMVGGWSDNRKNVATSDQISIYVVREGDSLSQIAEMFGVSVNTIRWGNDISGSTITPGETLIILPISGIRHTVKSGDTLASVSKMYKGDLDEVKKYNNLTETSKLAVGDIVVIPDGEAHPKATPTSQVVSRTRSVVPTADYSGYYIRPTTGIRSQGLHGYNAIDIAAPVGTAIVASASGRVIISRDSGWNGGYGQYIVIEHGNGTQTLYAHLNSNLVFVGQNVAQGQSIGHVGVTGKVTGPHLHFEVRGAKNPF